VKSDEKRFLLHQALLRQESYELMIGNLTESLGDVRDFTLVVFKITSSTTDCQQQQQLKQIGYRIIIN